MIRKILISTAVLLACIMMCVVFAACGDNGDGTATGKTAVISLPDNGSEGYSWDYMQWSDNDQGEANEMVDFFDVSEKKTDGTMEYTLTAKKAGQCEFDLDYAKGLDQAPYQVNYHFEVDQDMNITYIDKKIIQLDDNVEVPEIPDPLLQ